MDTLWNKKLLKYAQAHTGQRAAAPLPVAFTELICGARSSVLDMFMAL